MLKNKYIQRKREKMILLFFLKSNGNEEHILNYQTKSGRSFLLTDCTHYVLPPEAERSVCCATIRM